MTKTTDESPSFRSAEGLRAALARLQREGGAQWQRDPQAAELMRYAAERYAALARKHGLDPWEAAAAAFDAMRAPSTLRANDPWAIVTRAVQVTCIAEERARGLLCSVHQARRPRYSAYHDAERFSDRENPLPEYHPAFCSTDKETEDFSGAPDVANAIEDCITVFVLFGWPADVARAGVEYVCSRLADAPSRPSAYESLRRDAAARAILDVPQRAWIGMLRVLLGSPDPLHAHTGSGRGILLRLLIGEPLHALVHDQIFTDMPAAAALGPT